MLGLGAYPVHYECTYCISAKVSRSFFLPQSDFTIAFALSSMECCASDPAVAYPITTLDTLDQNTVMDDSLTGMFDLAQHTITTHPMLPGFLFYGFNYRVLCPSGSNTSSCQFNQRG